METATVLVAYHKDEKGLPEDIEYFTLQLPDNFYISYKHALYREELRKQIQNIYKSITGKDYVMAKFDKVEKYFDQ